MAEKSEKKVSHKRRPQSQSRAASIQAKVSFQLAGGLDVS